MRRFERVAVLMGGPSSEREVSLRSGQAVARGLEEAGYRVDRVVVEGRDLRLPSGVDAVFLAMHGAFGEDGEVQSMLDALRVPYTGSGAEASRRAMDKLASKDLFVRKGIPTPAWEVLGADGRRTLPLPVVVKPAREGSSVGVRRVLAEDVWPAACAEARRHGGDTLVEAYIEGREVTVGLVDGEVLPIVEIVAPDGDYDFAAKYGGTSRYLVPAPLDEGTADACRGHARAVYEALGCRGLGRVDLRVARDGESYVLEMNTIPGFTETSLLPKAAAAAGMGFAALCDRIMKSAAWG